MYVCVGVCPFLDVSCYSNCSKQSKKPKKIYLYAYDQQKKPFKNSTAPAIYHLIKEISSGYRV